MSDTANNLRTGTAPSAFQRVAHVLAVALSTVLSVGLIGAVSAKSVQRTPDAPAVSTAEQLALPSLAAVAPADPVTASATERATAVELIRDQTEFPPTPAEPLPVEPIVPPQPQYRTIRMEVTAYCACTKCCGPKAQGITASGKTVSYNGGRFVAADTSVLGFGTKLIIPGYAGGEAVEVIDRGGAIKGHRLDVYYPTHREARQWGRQWVDVVVVE